LIYNGAGETVLKTIVLYNTGNGAISMSSTGMLNLGTLDLSQSLTVTGASAHTFILSGPGPGTGVCDLVIQDYISGNLTTTNATALTKDGPGVWVLTNNNSNTGSLSIRDGTLVVSSIGNTNDSVNLGPFSTINLGAGFTTGRVCYVGTGEIVNKIIRMAAGLTNPAGGAIVDQSGTGTLEFQSDLTAANAPQAHTLTLQGSTSGIGQLDGGIPDNSATFNTSVLKAGTGLWILKGTNNTYTGPTIINGGTLALVGGCQITNSQTITVGSAGILDVTGLNGSTGIVIVAGQTLHGCGTVNGSVSVANLGTLAPGCSPSTLSIAGALTLNSSSILAYGLGGTNDETAVYGNLTAAGTLNVSDTGSFGPGTYTLFSYTGVLTYNGINMGTTPNAGLSYVVSTNTSHQVQLLVSTTGPAAGSYGAWTNYYGLSGARGSPNADASGDGMNNTNKFMAGFNPTNAAAYLHITSVTRPSGATTNVVVAYLGASGDTNWSGGPTSRTNVLEFTTGTITGTTTGNYANSSWTQVPGQTNVLGVGLSVNGGTGLGTATNMVDSGGATNKPSRYYRVRVLLP
jgi:fibronectin-binding autotransporter adhesin